MPLYRPLLGRSKLFDLVDTFTLGTPALLDADPVRVASGRGCRFTRIKTDVHSC